MAEHKRVPNLEELDEVETYTFLDFAMILELKDGRIWRDRRYYAEPFEAPEWVEQVEF